MHALEIIDAMSFAYYNLIKVDAFYTKVKYLTLSLLLTKYIILEVGLVYTHIGLVLRVPFVLMVLSLKLLQVIHSRRPCLATSTPRTEVR